MARHAVAQGEKQGAPEGRRGQAESEAVGARRGRGRAGVGGGRLAVAPPAVGAPAHAHALLVGQVQHPRAPRHAQGPRLGALQADALRLQTGGEAGFADGLQGGARLLGTKEGEGGPSLGEEGAETGVGAGRGTGPTRARPRVPAVRARPSGKSSLEPPTKRGAPEPARACG